MIYAFGAYGTNNIGDELIFAGLSKEYKGAIQIYVNKPTPIQAAVWYADFFTGKATFKQGDHLIIGGGGLLHCKTAVQDYYKMALLAKDAGASVTIEGIGAEGVMPEFVEDVKLLLSTASFISVRSTQSLRILKPLTSLRIQVRPDFVFNLTTYPPEPMERPTILVALAGIKQFDDYSELEELLKKYTVGDSPVRFVFIPHSHSYTGPHNNDVAAAEILWSRCEPYHARREQFLILNQYRDAQNVLQHVYPSVDGVIAYRYHALILSEIARVPVVVAAPTLKNMSYVEDAKRDGVYVAKHTLEEAFEQMLFSIRIKRGL